MAHTMGSQSAKKVSKNGDDAPKATKHENAIWTIKEKKRLVSFLSNHKSEAGDSATFKMQTFRAAAAPWEEAIH